MTTRKKKLALTGGILLILLAALFPLPVRDLSPEDRAFAVRSALHALQHPQSRVFLITGEARSWQPYHFSPLPDVQKLAGRPFLFQNTLADADAICLAAGMEPLPAEKQTPVPDRKEVLVQFDANIKAPEELKFGSGIYFSYHHGTLAAQGFRIDVYRSLLLRHAVFRLLWVS